MSLACLIFSSPSTIIGLIVFIKKNFVFYHEKKHNNKIHQDVKSYQT